MLKKQVTEFVEVQLLFAKNLEVAFFHGFALSVPVCLQELSFIWRDIYW
jgi:hypothetical protein